MTSAPGPIPGDTDLPPPVWRALEDHFADALDLFRILEPTRSLHVAPWSVFVALARGWRRTGIGAGPDELAAASGCSRRSVFRHLGALQAAGLVRPIGARNNARYGVGPALDPILRTFAADREPSVWRVHGLSGSARLALDAPDIEEPLAPGANVAPAPSAAVALGTTRREPSASLTPCSRSSARDTPGPISPSSPALAIPEGQPGTRSDPRPPEATSLINNNKDLNCSSSSAAGPLDPATSRRIACAALLALHRRAYPEIPPPRMLDPADVALVEWCNGRGTWDAATLEQMHLDAIQSACRTSARPPRPAYIWGQMSHFMEHVRRGRAQRELDQPKPLPRRKKRPPEAPLAPHAYAAAVSRQVVLMLDGKPYDLDVAAPAASPGSDS